MVKNLTAQSISQYVSTRGVRLRTIDLTLNQAIAQRLLDEISTSIARNKERSERMKKYFLLMFKKICGKYDMKEELSQALAARRHLLKSMVTVKDGTSQQEREIKLFLGESQESEEVTLKKKIALDKVIVQKTIEIADIDPLYGRQEKVKSSALEI